jgi:Fe-S protein assembly co-chaperone HscB
MNRRVACEAWTSVQVSVSAARRPRHCAVVVPRLQQLSSSSSPFPRSQLVLNHFEILGMPVSFSLDERQMKANYLKLMMDAHPDRRHRAAHGDHTSLEADNDFGPVVDEVASLVTKSFDVLQKPHTRAGHLLELHEHPLEEAATTELVGEAFLMGIMELREAIAETSDNNKLQEMWRNNKKAIQETCDGLELAFGSHDWDEAVRLTAQLQYWNRIEETLRDKLDSLE